MALHFERIGLAPDLVNYRECLDLQREVHREVVAGTRGNTVLMVEHDPVYTAGRRTEQHEYPWDGTEVVPIGRGGKLTYHGPGMLVGYPIVRLPIPLDVVRFVRVLEEVIVAVVRDFGCPPPPSPAAPGRGCSRTSADRTARSPPSASRSPSAPPCTALP